MTISEAESTSVVYPPLETGITFSVNIILSDGPFSGVLLETFQISDMSPQDLSTFITPLERRQD